MISIVVVSAGVQLWDMFTAPAVASLSRHATQEHELITVDNGGLSRGTVNIPVMVPYAAAMNAGAAVATGNRLLLLNNDIEARGPYLNALGQGDLEGPTPRIVATDAHYLEGWALSVSHGLWDILGGFNTNYVNSWEDVDFCWRAQRLGVPLTHLQAWPVAHHYGQTRNRIEGANAHDNENFLRFLSMKGRPQWNFARS